MRLSTNKGFVGLGNLRITLGVMILVVTFAVISFSIVTNATGQSSNEQPVHSENVAKISPIAGLDVTNIRVLGAWASILMIFGGLILVWISITKGDKKGFGDSTIRALGTTFLLPVVFLLALANIVSAEVIATLLGAAAGQILSKPEYKSVASS